MTYLELNQFANCVGAAVVKESGLGNEPIGLLFDQGLQAIAAILGTLKAAKVCTPLDPLTPSSRLNYIVEELRTRVLLTDRHNYPLAEGLARDTCKVINIDALDSGLSTGNLGIDSSKDDLSFIIYTSGSTGQPKGVLHDNRSVLHTIMNYANAFHICQADRLTLLPAYGVLGGIWNIFNALLNGASLFPFDLRQEGLEKLSGLMVREGITIYYSPATILRQLMGSVTKTEKFKDLRLIHLGGEHAYKKDVELYREHFSADCILAHTLGSTEAPTFRCHFIDEAVEITGNHVPSGYAMMPDMELLLLNEAGEEVGVNETGEIAVRSSYLSLGYWRRPDLTNETFLPDPDGEDRPICLTGDLGRLLPNGCLVHFGRKDFQVIIRGYRVEVAEVEMALLDRGDVKEVVVVARQDRSGDPRLIPS